MAVQESDGTLGEARRQQVHALLMQNGAVTITELRTRFGISSMTGRRDLDVLERRGLARRTHGGAVVPPVIAQENSFAQRLGMATEAKQRLADAAVTLLQPGETVFLDSCSTAYFVAWRIAQLGLAVHIVINSGAIMQAIAGCEHEQVQLSAIGGTLRRLTGSYVGRSAVRAIREQYADRVVVSVMGIANNGVLMDGDPLEAEVSTRWSTSLSLCCCRLTSRSCRRAAVRRSCRSNAFPKCSRTGLAPREIEQLLARGARQVLTA